MKKAILLILFCSAILQSKAQSSLQIGNTTVQVDTLITGLDVPWEITYHDGYIWMTERKGIVSRVDINTGIKQVILNLTTSVIQQSESGLLGMALHPDFSNTPEVFMAYTYSSSGNIRERIVKYTWNGTTLINPVILLNNLPGNSTHNGCRLFFLPDGTMLASTGDTQNPNYPQNLTALNGKMLRMNPDGTVPPDNPFPGSLVYSFGHRNVQGVCILPNDSILLSEHGASTDDEVQFLYYGRNYGWPNVEGFCNTSTEITFCNNNNVVEPIIAYTPTIAPSDLLYYTNPNFPEWDSCVIMTVLKDKHVRALKMNAPYDTITSNTIYLNNLFGRLRDITIGPNNEIYIATNGASWANTDPNTHSIIRITPPNPTTGQGNTLPTPTIEAFPNPAHSTLNIRLQHINLQDNMKLQIENMLGQCVYSAPLKQSSLSLDLAGLKGVYLLRIIEGDSKSIAVKKFVSQ